MTDSVLLSDEAGTHIESDAVVGILRHFGGRWAIPRILLQVIPRPLRDAGYRVVARNRRRWFGGAEQCRLPDVSDRDRLLP